ncbi:Uncharacterised protein [Mycobacteroides abscessus subsp. abscessus]|nr:Uncharacterised protein [Mycobacteroides abscessus subsp. abscessus]SKT92790.1 Uncharacterised protein [Mycobacteroides abscessus subsp. abscessus]
MSSTSTGTSTPPGAVIVVWPSCRRTRYSMVATTSSSVRVVVVT